jgi:hypothetical protein
MMYMELITGRSQDDAGDPRLYTLSYRYIHSKECYNLNGGEGQYWPPN